MNCSITPHSDLACRYDWRQWFAVVGIASYCVATFGVVSQAATAYYSFAGGFANGTETQSFLFNLNSALRSPAPFTLRTWHHGGGTNAAGDVIVAGGFDPILRLYNDTPVLIAENDDYNAPTVRDSLIDWSTSGMPVQLPVDGYQLDLVAYNSLLGGRTGNWAVDLLADAAKFTLTGVAGNNGTGATTIDSLTIGSDDVRLPAKVRVAPLTSLSIAGPLIVGDTGSGEIIVTTGALNTDNGVLGYSNSYLGFQPNSIGNVTLSLGGSWSDNQGINTVGWQGEGNLRIESGSLASLVGPVVLAEYGSSEGNVTVTGHDSHLVTNSAIDVGEAGIGYLRIEKEGHVSSTGFWTVGADTVGVLGQGTVEVDGKDSLWSTGRLIVGYGAFGGPFWGQGIVRVTNGGRISTAGNAQIGYSSYGHDSSVTLTGAALDASPATWQVSGNLFLAGDDVNPTNATNSKLTINSGGFVNVAGTTTVWNGGGTLELLGGELETGSLIVKPGATFTHNDGTLTINGGAFDPGTSEYTIDGGTPSEVPVIRLTDGANGALSWFLRIGKSNRGAMELRGRADFSAALVQLAEESTSIGGSLLVENAHLTTGDFWVGERGIATATISNSGHIEVTGPANRSDVIIGGWPGSGGTLIVQGQNSRLTSRFVPQVGIQGTGLLRIESGGQVSNSTQLLPASIGTWLNSQGTVQVRGTDLTGTPSRWTIVAPTLAIGEYGRGVLEVTDGGQVTASGSAFIAQGVGSDNSSATVTGTGSSWSVSGPLYVGGSGAVAGRSGLLAVAHNGHVNASTVTVWQPGTVELEAGSISAGGILLAGGALRGNGSISLGSTLTNSGTVSPGLSAGVLAINGNYVQETAGTLAIEIGGTAPTQFDRLLVGGSATLHGTLQISLIDPLGGSNVYEPQSGDSFKFLTAAGGLDLATFDSYIWPVLPGGLRLGALYDYDDASVSLKVVGVLGDYNLNDVVDAADYVLWRETYRGPNVLPPSLAADGDGDGDVDNNDWNVWRAHFGQIAPPIVSAVGSVAEVVPEPAETLMAISTVGLLVTFTRLRRFKEV